MSKKEWLSLIRDVFKPKRAESLKSFLNKVKLSVSLNIQSSAYSFLKGFSAIDLFLTLRKSVLTVRFLDGIRSPSNSSGTFSCLPFLLCGEVQLSSLFSDGISCSPVLYCG